VPAETVTVMCVKHRRKVTLGQSPPGPVIIFLHDPPGSLDYRCDSARFSVRREYQLSSREAAQAELLVLQLQAEHQREVEDSSEEKPR
jgi:hypothetical protein